jgi:hypothetical protein
VETRAIRTGIKLISTLIVLLKLFLRVLSLFWSQLVTLLVTASADLTISQIYDHIKHWTLGLLPLSS